jgi:hypothetical protein
VSILQIGRIPQQSQGSAACFAIPPEPGGRPAGFRLGVLYNNAFDDWAAISEGAYLAFEYRRLERSTALEGLQTFTRARTIIITQFLRYRCALTAGRRKDTPHDGQVNDHHAVGEFQRSFSTKASGGALANFTAASVARTHLPNPNCIRHRNR